jgi:cell division FtsZ-interacting protein ZapD
VTGVPVPLVERLRVHAVQPAHARAEIGLRRLHEQVDVIAHQAVREQSPTLPLDDLPQQRHIALPIDVIDIDRQLPNATRKHMHDRVGELFTRLPSHTGSSR